MNGMAAMKALLLDGSAWEDGNGAVQVVRGGGWDDDA